MQDRQQHVVDFYTRHPISAAHILAKVRTTRGSLGGLTPPDLFAYDQDHYGGVAANDAIAARAVFKPGMQVADFCAGLGGPARYFAHRFGVTVIGIELTPQRVKGAGELTRAVGLEAKVRIVEGNVLAAPLADAGMDAVYSQEALLHVPDKPQAIREAARILRPGGRFCFTDWIAHRALEPHEAETMWRGIAAQSVESVAGYLRNLRAAGLQPEGFDDLTDEWGIILDERRRMYVRLREEALAAGNPAGNESFYAAYVRLVELVQARVLGGARFTAVKPA